MADGAQHLIGWRVQDGAAVFSRTHQMVQQDRDVVAFVDVLTFTHKQDTRNPKTGCGASSGVWTRCPESTETTELENVRKS